MLLSVHIRADMRSKRYFRSGYIVFRGILGQLRALSPYDPFINFFHPVFHFSGRSGISAPFFCGYPRK